MRGLTAAQTLAQLPCLIVSGAPAKGVIQMQITGVMLLRPTNARLGRFQVPLSYTAPNKDFSGSDTVQIDVEVGNQKHIVKLSDYGSSCWPASACSDGEAKG